MIEKMNGTIRSIGKFESNKQTGLWKAYNMYGELVRKGMHENDLKTGEWEEVNFKGVKSVGVYIKGVRTGKW